MPVDYLQISSFKLNLNWPWQCLGEGDGTYGLISASEIQEMLEMTATKSLTSSLTPLGIVIKKDCFI